MLVTRMVSVAEIIKREYADAQRKGEKVSSEGAGVSQLHQYNEIGCLEDLQQAEQGGSADLVNQDVLQQAADPNRQQELLTLLSGSKQCV